MTEQTEIAGQNIDIQLSFPQPNGFHANFPASQKLTYVNLCRFVQSHYSVLSLYLFIFF